MRPKNRKFKYLILRKHRVVAKAIKSIIKLANRLQLRVLQRVAFANFLRSFRLFLCFFTGYLTYYRHPSPSASLICPDLNNTQRQNLARWLRRSAGRMSFSFETPQGRPPARRAKKFREARSAAGLPRSIVLSAARHTCSTRHGLSASGIRTSAKGHRPTKRRTS